MQKIERILKNQTLARLTNNPVVALIGSRQAGKSTLAKEVLKEFKKTLYIDLELESDLLKVEQDPERFFELYKDHLICLDEIQLLPNIFKTLRSVVDKKNRNAQFLILGSASKELINKSGETLAGRISYLEVTPFNWLEAQSEKSFFDYWLQRGYPKALLAESTEISTQWREDYLRSFIERDIPQWGFNIPGRTLRRFCTMLAHSHEQTLNASKLSNSIDLSSTTVSRYLDILEQTFIIRSLQPYHTNLKKRLVKSPKIYIRDTGLLHTLLKIDEQEDLLSHPTLGSSFEIMVIENLIPLFPRHEAFFYRDSTGNEIDLILKKGQELIAIEIKASKAPKLTSSFWNALKFLKPDKSFIISQTEDTYPIEKDVLVTNLNTLITQFKKNIYINKKLASLKTAKS